MKVIFLNTDMSSLADRHSTMLLAVKEKLLGEAKLQEVTCPDLADVILLEEKTSFKDFRYIKQLQSDRIIGRYPNKVYTINRDDCATGLLRGVYTSLPITRFDPRFHAAIPYMEYPNELIFSENIEPGQPSYLASWRGNTKSNRYRWRMIESLKGKPDILLETTDSWLNHEVAEKETYVRLLLNSKFSLCPAGWAPVSFRIYESMAMGRCPVILADHYVPPKGPNWNDFAIFYPQKQVSKLYTYLKQHEELHAHLGAQAHVAWQNFFSQGVVAQYVAKTLLTLIETAPVCTQDYEFKRWQSLSLYWKNNWTLPQRVVNKVVKLSRSLHV